MVYSRPKSYNTIILRAVSAKGFNVRHFKSLLWWGTEPRLHSPDTFILLWKYVIFTFNKYILKLLLIYIFSSFIEKIIALFFCFTNCYYYGELTFLNDYLANNIIPLPLWSSFSKVLSPKYSLNLVLNKKFTRNFHCAFF